MRNRACCQRFVNTRLDVNDVNGSKVTQAIEPRAPAPEPRVTVTLGSAGGKQRQTYSHEELFRKCQSFIAEGSANYGVDLAFPGEEPESVKPPEAVAEFILKRLASDAATGELVRAEA